MPIREGKDENIRPNQTALSYMFNKVFYMYKPYEALFHLYIL